MIMLWFVTLLVGFVTGALFNPYGIWRAWNAFSAGWNGGYAKGFEAGCKKVVSILESRFEKMKKEDVKQQEYVS